MEFLYLLLLLPLIPILLLLKNIIQSNPRGNSNSESLNFSRPYPLIGHLLAYYYHKGDSIFYWFCDHILSSPSSTFIAHRPFAKRIIMTGDPIVVEHILKTQFPIYQKGDVFTTTLQDFFGNGILNVDGTAWKLQRRLASHKFNTNSLRCFVETVVENELSTRLIPILHDAAKYKKVIDLQDILQRFTFDNICNIAFGYDPKYLLPSLPKAKLASSFEDAMMLSTQRFRTLFPFSWKVLRFLNIGSEKRLREAILEVREFASSLIRQKKKDIMLKSSLDTDDLLSLFLNSGEFDEETVIDVMINFIVGGRDTTSTALVWFFWLLHHNNRVEKKILSEVEYSGKNREENMEHTYSTLFDEVKEMVYTHAALSESMRLYPPIPLDTKEVVSDDILPDGTIVEKGMRVSYFPYAMGRSAKIWGDDWTEYRPERWLIEAEDNAGESKWKFVPRDAYSYPVFQAGQRTCIGKDMAFLQMKTVVAGVLAKFKVIPVLEEGYEPVYVPNLTSKMQGGLPVLIEERKFG